MEKLIDQAQTIIKDHHLRWTKQRKMMIKSVARHPDRYFNIVEIDQYLREQFPGLSHDTIYRNFKEFEKLGIVELRQHHDQMQVKYSCDFTHHHHFICDIRGRVQEIQCHQLIRNSLKSSCQELQITGHRFELHGICAQCQKKSLQ